MNNNRVNCRKCKYENHYMHSTCWKCGEVDWLPEGFKRPIPMDEDDNQNGLGD